MFTGWGVSVTAYQFSSFSGYFSIFVGYFSFKLPDFWTSYIFQPFPLSPVICSHFVFFVSICDIFVFFVKTEPCEQTKETGPCEGNFTRWYYDKADRICRPFRYGGCKGNQNNFLTEMACQHQCLQSGKAKRKLSISDERYSFKFVIII